MARWLIKFIYTEIALKGGIEKLDTQKAKAEACESINVPSTMELAESATARYLGIIKCFIKRIISN